MADVDFMISTGRMPIAEPGDKLERRTPRYTPAQIQAILDYVATFVSGPPVPTVDLATADVAAGGVAYRLNCASCHHATGSGGVLAYGVEVPDLKRSTPVEVVEALRTGPGRMPPFAAGVIPDQQATDIAAYVDELQHPDDRGGFDLGGFAPSPRAPWPWCSGWAAWSW